MRRAACAGLNAQELHAILDASRITNSLAPTHLPATSPSLTQGFRCDNAHFEITSQCNLACVYCAVSQPGYQGLTLSQDQAKRVADWLLDHGVANINLNGHGETTIVPEWEKIVQPLLRSKAKCHIITNASKAFSEDEIDALCRLKTITISCDTLDPILHARLRRKSKLHHLLNSISRIRLAAEQRGLKPPLILLSCVLGAENSEHLEEYILTAKCMGIHAIQFCSLTDYPMPEDSSFKLHPLSTLSKEKLRKLKQLLLTHTPKNEGSGAEFLSVQAGIYTEIDANLA
ncbi:MAG: radical SAM protein [Cyanobacteriota bacterium]|nr:radical SAM protein [Cyanobacteriota bacterium]